jgi:hypothetical protein
MTKATLTEADFEQIVHAAELAIKKTPPSRKTQPSDEVPKVRGITPETEWIIKTIVLPFLVALSSGLAKDIAKYLAEGTLNGMKRLIGCGLKENPDFESASRDVEKILTDLNFPKESRHRIVGQVRKQAERISKKAKTNSKRAKV